MLKFIDYCIEYPKKIIWLCVGIMLLCAAFIPMITIDTDPENMLSQDEPVRVAHNALKKKFKLHDMLVVGIVNDAHPEGVFNQESLSDVYALSDFAYTLRYKEDGEFKGVIPRDVMTPTNMDYIEAQGQGRIKFEWLMNKAPSSEQEAQDLKRRLLENELFYNTIISEDGKALALYLPITSKDESFDLSKKLQSKIDSIGGKNVYHITGLPVAEDTFGIEMFIQMAISAPAAMLLIFVLIFLFFRKLRLVYSPLIIAMISVICTMGLLIGTGNTVHIMSSMIPIFIMPIAVLDTVHILSEFYDRYQLSRDRKKTIKEVVGHLFKPMLFTSLTSAAGFASLAITPIPPVRVFGIFVAIGILLAWLFTMTFVPAYIMLTSEESLNDFGSKTEEGKDSWVAKLLSVFQRVSYNKAKWVVLSLLLLTVWAGYGITKININDNPVKWFTKSHPIRVADAELNKHFGGTYMAFLSLKSDEESTFNKNDVLQAVNTKFGESSASILNTVKSIVEESAGQNSYEIISESILDYADDIEDDSTYDMYADIADFISLMEIENTEVFKRPEVLNYILKLEDFLQKEGGVGKSSSIAKMVRYIHKELNESNEAYNTIPNNVAGVGQCLLSYQNSHIPERLRHFVSSDYKSANVWLQLKSGDNKDMEKTIAAVDRFMQDNPPPSTLKEEWFGLTYLNVIWQQKMVKGMLEAFLGSFVIVFLMMSFLFRSIKWALLCMIPLSLTILIIYGLIGWVGKDYDMPVAVLSSLALGLAVDFAIHFLSRSRDKLKETGDWAETSAYMFGEPSRAILRNMVVIAIGFLPLLLATLIPYRTVGVILALILFLSGIVTLVLLPSIIKVFNINK